MLLVTIPAGVVFVFTVVIVVAVTIASVGVIRIDSFIGFEHRRCACVCILIITSMVISMSLVFFNLISTNAIVDGISSSIRLAIDFVDVER